MTETSPSIELPTSRRGWAALLDRMGVRPSKGLGQHFLFERGIVQRLVRAAGIGESDLVLEIGPGLGILTNELLAKAGEVVVIELDRRLAEYLRTTFVGNPKLTVVEGNAVKIATADIMPPDREFIVAANLPYSVGAAVVRHLLEQPYRPRRLAVMLQKEVAERIVARPPEMTVLGVATQFYAETKIAFDVPPSVFVPPPKIESAVVLLDVRPELPLPDELHDRFFRIVNAGFRQKRKMITNSLAAELGLPKSDVEAWLAESGIDSTRRAQTLAVADWVALTRNAAAGVA